MVGKRIAAAAVVIAVMAMVLAGDYFLELDALLNLVLVVGTVLCLREFYSMCEASEQTPFRGFGMVSSVLLVVFHWMSLPGTMERLGLGGYWMTRARGELVPLGLLVAVLGSFWLQATKRDNAKLYESISATLLGVLYIWFLPSFLIRIAISASTASWAEPTGGASGCGSSWRASP